MRCRHRGWQRRRTRKEEDNWCRKGQAGNSGSDRGWSSGRRSPPLCPAGGVFQACGEVVGCITHESGEATARMMPGGSRLSGLIDQHHGDIILHAVHVPASFAGERVLVRFVVEIPFTLWTTEDFKKFWF